LKGGFCEKTPLKKFLKSFEKIKDFRAFSLPFEVFRMRVVFSEVEFHLKIFLVLGDQTASSEGLKNSEFFMITLN